jgi:hypothetical protein
VTEQPILALLDFNKLFQVNSDASGTTIGVVMSQKGRSIVFSFYDQEFYVIIQALKKWRHYLLPKEFVCLLTTRHCSTLIVKVN